MTGRHRTRASSPTTNAARLALAGLAVSMGAVAFAAQASADPADPAAPQVPVAPGDAPAPGQPVVEAAGPPPAPGAPNFDPSAAVGHVPDEQAHYGSGSGPLGFLRDAWHQAKDPYDMGDSPDGQLPTSAPPEGAGPAPALPPGYVSTNAPGSETVMPAGPPPPHPDLPPGYYSRSGPPPPGYFDPPPAPGDPAVLPMVAPGAAPAPGAYVPVHSPPPPPLELPPS